MATLSLTTTLLHLLSLPHFPTPNAAQTPLALSCPPYTTREGTTSVLTGIDSSSSNTGLIKLAKTVTPGTLCTLWTSQTSEDGNKSFYIPVGRSYDGNDWERAAGKYDTLSWDCSAGDGTCLVTLPDTDTQVYRLTSYLHTLTAEQTSARFFERASFGPTSGLLSVATNEANMASWIQTQFDTTVTPMTSHREYFRKRLNPRSLEVYKYGRSGPHPCDVNSRWRSFAFTRKDAVMSTYDNTFWPMMLHNVTLETKTVNGNDKFLWRYAGHVRTMLNARPMLSDGTAIPDGIYDVCGVDELPGEAFASEDQRMLYARFQIVYEDTCVHVAGGNPTVSIDPDYLVDESPSGGYVLDFTAQGAFLEAIGTQYPSSVLLFISTSYYSSNSDQCSPLPDPTKADFRSKGWIYSPYYEGRIHPNWDPPSRNYLDPPVYAVMPGGKYYLNDRRLTLLENTPQNPLPDGGGTMSIESVYKDINNYDADDAKLVVVDVDENPRTPSYLSGNEQAIFCSNGPPNFFNENDCTLSTVANACVREDGNDEDTVVVTKLVPATLDKINGHAGTTVFQISGLTFTAKTRLPCTSGSTSRWVIQTEAGSNTKSGCDALGDTTVGSGTYDAFVNLLYYSVTDNEFLRDVTMVSCGL